MDMDMDMDMDEDDGDTSAKALPEAPGIKVVANYKPQVQAQQKSSVSHFIDPKTGKQVAVDAMTEHMRIGNEETTGEYVVLVLVVRSTWLWLAACVLQS